MFRIFTPAPFRMLRKFNSKLVYQSLNKSNPGRVLSVSLLSTSRGGFVNVSSAVWSKRKRSILEEKLEEGSINKFDNPDVPRDPEGRLIVYEGALKYQIMKLKFFSLSTSAMGLMMQPVIWSKLAESSLGANIAAFSITGIFTFVTPLLIHSLAKKYVTEIYYIPETDSYSAATFNFFNRKKELPFKVEEVVVPDVPGPFSTILIEQNKNNQITKTPLFVAPNTFNDPVHYGRMMGYDKPIDFHLNSDVEKIVKDKETVSNKN